MILKQENGGREKRKSYPSQRPLFDQALRMSKFFDAFSRLKDGKAEASELIGIISDLNTSKDQAQYTREIVGIKKVFRDLVPAMEYSEAMAQFLADAAAMIGSLSKALGDDIIFGLGRAAENDNYLETVDKAVSGLEMDRLSVLKQRVAERKEEKAEARAHEEAAADNNAGNEALPAVPNMDVGNAELTAPLPAESNGVGNVPLLIEALRDDEAYDGRTAFETLESIREASAGDELTAPVPAEDEEMAPPKREAEETGEESTPKRRYGLMLGLGIIAAIVASVAFSQRDDGEDAPQKPEAVETKRMPKDEADGEPVIVEEQVVEEPSVVPISTVEKEMKPVPKTDSQSGKRPVKKPTRRELLLQRLNRLSPENPDEATAQAEEFAKAIRYSRTEDAVEVVGRLGTVVSESPDQDAEYKKKFAVSVLRQVAISGDDTMAVSAISELARLASREIDLVPVLEGLEGEEAIRDSQPRMEAVKKALEEGNAE